MRGSGGRDGGRAQGGERTDAIAAAPPDQTVCYRCVQEHLATWLAQIRDGHEDDRLVPAYVERALRR